MARRGRRHRRGFLGPHVTRSGVEVIRRRPSVVSGKIVVGVNYRITLDGRRQDGVGIDRCGRLRYHPAQSCQFRRRQFDVNETR